MKKQKDPKVTIEMKRGERRLYDRLRAGFVEKRPGRPSGPRDLLLLLPDFTVLLVRLMRDARVPVGGKAIALLSIGYVLSPLDAMPTLVFGPIGLIDDLFVVTAALSRLLNYVHPDVVRSHWSGQGDALDAIQRATEWSETQVRSLLHRFIPSLLRR